MGNFGLDLSLGLVALAIWLVTAPFIRRLVRAVAQSADGDRRVLIGEGLMLLHIVLLVVALIGLVDAAWDLM